MTWPRRPTVPRRARLRRAMLGPVAATAWTCALTLAGLAGGISVGAPEWVLTWLLLGLTAGYALSGSV